MSFTSDLAVAQRGAGANFSVDVAAGHAVILGTSVSDQGKYVVQNTATLNLTMSAAPGSGTRFDLVYAQVRDKQADGGSSYDWVIDKVTGTVGAGLPATPANAIPLAQIGPIISTTPSITTSLITSLRTYAAAVGAVSPPLGRASRRIMRGSVSLIDWTTSVSSGSVTFPTPFANTPDVVLGPLGFITSNTFWTPAAVTTSTTGFTWEGRTSGSYTGTNQPGFRWIATDA